MNKFLLGAFYVLLILVFSFVVAAVYAYLKAKLPEKSENEKTITPPFTPINPSCRTQAYAPPAHIPPKNPQARAYKSVVANDGLTMNIAPMNAHTSAKTLFHVIFSPRESHVKNTVKNGESLFSIKPSASGMWLSA